MDLADGGGVGWVVLGVVKTCSDGALDGIWSFFVFLEAHACFCTDVRVTCRVNRM